MMHGLVLYCMMHGGGRAGIPTRQVCVACVLRAQGPGLLHHMSRIPLCRSVIIHAHIISVAMKP